MTTHKKSQSTQQSTITTSHETSTAAPDGASVLQAAPPPPTVHAPSVPANVDLTIPVGRGAGVWPTLGSLAASIASEIQSAPTFGDDFGKKIDQAIFAQTLAYAAGWRAEWEATNAWLKYVRIGNSAAVRAAKKQLERFRGAFEHALALDSTVAKRYPQLNELYRSQSAIGTRSANTRASRKKSATTSTKVDTTTAHAAVTVPVTPATTT